MADPVRVEGLRELDRKLGKMEEVAAKKVLRGAMMDAANPIWRSARANAEATGIRGQDSGALAAAMGRWFRVLGRKRFALFIGPRSRSAKGVALWSAKHGREPKGGRLRHAHLTEFGTSKAPAQPYLRPAFDTQKGNAIRTLGRKLKARIEKIARTS